LAAAAARAKADKSAHSKKIITDEDIHVIAHPLPSLKMSGAENGEEVVAAIKEYKQTHTPEQTEQAIRTWFEEYDEELAAAIKDNLDIQHTRAASVRNGYDLCQNPQPDRDYEDYKKCQVRGVAEARGERHEQAEISRNGEWIVRLQHSLTNIRISLLRMGLNYTWFKIRTTNGIDRF
jgi:hypothetical protein